MTHFELAQNAFCEAVRKHEMLSTMKNGCLLGLSGGADSVLLLHLVSALSKKEGFPLVALHVHHGIRTDEAERDLAFSRDLCKSLGVAFREQRICVLIEAERTGESVEQAARRMRYDIFKEACRERGLGAILTAHHASDSAETVLLHLARGTGTKGLCGIPAVRTEGDIPVLRPLITLTRLEIENALKERGIRYVTDSTNADTAYRRNYVREELMPRFLAINPSFEKAVGRMSDGLSTDMAYLDLVAAESYTAAKDKDALSVDALLSLHAAICYRVLLLHYKTLFPLSPLPERVHIDALAEGLAQKKSFVTPFPDNIYARVYGGRVVFDIKREPFHHEKQKITFGENVLSDGGKILVLEKGSLPSSSNVYKTSIHRDLSSATINGDMYVRAKADGDAYRYGAVTHKVKKLFCDAHIPPDVREHIPLLCDDAGILWVPHFGVRDDGGKDAAQRDLTLCYIPPENKTLL